MRGHTRIADSNANHAEERHAAAARAGYENSLKNLVRILTYEIHGFIHALSLCLSLSVCFALLLHCCRSVESQRTYAGQPASLPSVSSFSLFLPGGWLLL